MLIFCKKIHFIDKKEHFKDGYSFFFLHLENQKPRNMESYIITLGTYLILMLFFKVFFAVAGKE